MTSPEYLLARATAKGGSYEIWVQGTTVRFTATEIGYLLGSGVRDSMPDGALRIALLKYASGSDSDRQMLVRDLINDGVGRMDWLSHAGFSAMSRAAVHEFLSARLCPECNGTAEVRHGNALKDCPDCQGTGRKKLSDATRALICGVPMETFRRGPAERYYLDKLRLLGQWESIALWRIIDRVQERETADC